MSPMNNSTRQLLQSYEARNILLVAFFSSVVAVIVYQCFFQSLSKIPGPFLARFTRLWELRQVASGNLPKQLVALHNRYGSVVRLAPNRYSIADPEATKEIYAHASKYVKSDYYDGFADPHIELTDVFSERDPAQHASKRRKIANLYSMTSLLGYESFVDSCNIEFCERLNSFAKEGTSFDLPQWIQYYSFDVIGEITFGESFGLVRTGLDERRILYAIDKTIRFGSLMGIVPEFRPWIIFLSQKLGISVPIQIMLDYINSRTSFMKAQGIDTGKNDFTTKLLNLQEKGKLDANDIEKSVGSNVVAGSDSTSASISGIIYYLLKNPESMKKLYAEIDQFEASGQLSNPVTFKEAQNMPYLQAVIKEAMRIHPAAGQILPRVVPRGGATLAGHFFPEGTHIGSSALVIHQNKEIFGADADTFRPERWLVDKEKTSLMDRNIFTFGAGARTCIGKNISTLEITKIIPEIFRNLEFKLVEPSSKWKLESAFFVRAEFLTKVELRKKSNLEVA